MNVDAADGRPAVSPYAYTPAVPTGSLSGVVYHVDASYFIFRAYHSMPPDMVDADGNATHALYGFATKPFIATRTLDEKNVSRLRELCRERGATINDAALTAYCRVLARRLGRSAREHLEIPIMVDMRRYAPETEFTSLRNLSSMVITRIRQRDGEPFEETLLKVKSVMDGLKGRRIGLGGLMKLSFPFLLCGERLGSRLLKRALKAPLICMTNIGELDSNRLSFKGSPIQSAFLCGSIKFKPHFQLALSGFAGTLTLSVNLYGSPEDRRMIDSFLQEVNEELMET